MQHLNKIVNQHWPSFLFQPSEDAHQCRWSVGGSCCWWSQRTCCTKARVLINLFAGRPDVAVCAACSCVKGEGCHWILKSQHVQMMFHLLHVHGPETGWRLAACCAGPFWPLTIMEGPINPNLWLDLNASVTGECRSFFILIMNIPRCWLLDFGIQTLLVPQCIVS